MRGQQKLPEGVEKISKREETRAKAIKFIPMRAGKSTATRRQRLKISLGFSSLRKLFPCNS